MRRQQVARKPRCQARSLADYLRVFLTPALWKQAQKCRPGRESPRWKTQPLVLVLLFATWCAGDSVAERFEIARNVCAVCLNKRRRPGRTVQGFQKALSRLPLRVLRVLAAGLRQALARCLAGRLFCGGFIPIGCDGSRVECPRTTELEQRLGRSNKKKAAPSLWVTALVHLRLGVPWAWRLGKGNASERWHLEQLLPLLPSLALLVADAGYFGYELTAKLMQAQVSFLLRMSSTVSLYTLEEKPLRRFREGMVYYWPREVERAGRDPLRLRLLRIRARKKRHDVWLLTNVQDSRRLSLDAAAQFYRWRWENEGQFRAYKRTLKKVKLDSRTVRLVHREAEGSLLAMQLLLAQGALAMPTTRKRLPTRVPTPAAPPEPSAAAPEAPAEMCSPRKVLLAVRAELARLQPRPRPRLRSRLAQACRERRARTSAKATQCWPRRKPHKPPRPPKILTLCQRQKARISQLETEAA